MRYLMLAACENVATVAARIYAGVILMSRSAISAAANAPWRARYLRADARHASLNYGDAHYCAAFANVAHGAAAVSAYRILIFWPAPRLRQVEL